MGACFISFHLDGDMIQAKAKFTELQERDRYDNGHSYSGGIGMATGLTFKAGDPFKDSDFPTRQDAEQWLAENAQKWSHALAVKVRGEQGWYVGAWCSS